MAGTVAKITGAGIPVLGHIGLLPQRSASTSGFTVQGKTAASATRLLHDALALQKAGVYGIVLEAVPPQIAELITERLEVFTIGIGAGAGCSGQVLVQCDMAGNFPTGRRIPKFVKQYGNVWDESMRAITQYKEEVKAGTYPTAEHCYKMDEKELEMFKNVLENTSMSRFEH